MYANCHHFISNCTQCRAVTATKTVAPLQKSKVPTSPGQIISIDYVGPMITSLRGNKYIFTVLDKFSNYLHAHPTKEKSTNEALNYLMNNYFPLQGCPQTITSDNDPAFASDMMNAVYTAFGINHITTASYHPQSNKVERSHRFISEYFKKNIEDNYQCWDDVLPRIIMTYQSTPGENGLCPLEIHLNRDINLPYDYLFGVQRPYTRDRKFQ
jgi:hypothetical protein